MARALADNILANRANTAAKHNKGFTLIELVVVLLVVAILSVFVAQKIGNVTSMKAAAFAKKLRADIRYAQNVAMTRNRRTRVYFNGTGTAPTSESYAVVVDGAPGVCTNFVAVSDPAGGSDPVDGGNLTVRLDAKDYAGITVFPATTSCLEYDSLGRPYNCTGATPPPCQTIPSAADISFTVRANGVAVGPAVTVTAGTGAVN